MRKGKRKGIGRRILGVVLSVILTLGLMPEMPGSKMVVQAAGSEPGVTAYATRDQLMTAFQQDGNNTTIGKIVFGKNYEDNPQEWYILGKDTGVEGDNIVIFAASSIIEKHAFSAGTGEEFGIGDAVYDDYHYYPPGKVYQTHYGKSTLRAKLKSIAADTSYFTSAEQKLMQATTIRTRDARNGGTYTTTDVLYLLDATGDVFEVSYHAGTHNSLAFPYLRYPECWNFWLRLPAFNSPQFSASLVESAWISLAAATNKRDVRPASNINLTDVSFAAAASAPTTGTMVAGSIAEGTAMSLRLDGSNMSIGKVLYNTGANCITAQKGKTNGAVTLVVQGNDGTNDWYYSRKVDGTVIVSVDDMKNALSASGITNISLADCKIWLETTTDALTYAVQAEETQTLFSVPAQVDGVYQISNALELNWLAFSVNHEFSDMNAKLTANIAMNGIDWTMMENYAGTLDGAGHTISGLNQHKGFDDHKHGFIRTLASGGVVKNLTFTKAYIWNREGSGPISAVIAYTNNGTIEKCVVKNSLIQSAQTTLAVVAGENNGTIRNCASISNKVKRRHTSVNNKAASGFVWSNGTNAKIENCMVYDCIYEEASVNYALTQSNAGTITNCYYYEASETLSDAVANGVIEAKTAEQFASGAVCYLLNGSTSKGDLVWGQTLGTDNYPVYKTENNTVCKASTQEIYSNHNQYGPTGFCITCGSFEKPEIVNDEYRIENVGQLLWFAEFVNSGNKSANAKLTADIDMKNIAWTTICETPLYYKEYGTGCDYGYRGTFDGNGHVISNLTVTSSAASAASVGLFGTVSGTIKNLGMKNFTLVDKGKDMRAGAIVGQLITANGKVADCYVIGATIETEDNVAGGIAGCVYEGTVENCYVVDATISGAKGRFGYVTGDVCADGGNGDGTDRPGVVKNCFTNGAKISSDRKGTNSVVGGEAKVSAERFASGEIAYLLNDSTSTGNLTWYQKLDESADAYPVLDSTRGTVYLIYGCDEKTPVGYSNANKNETHEPEEDDGDCTTAILCRVCEVVLTEAKESHIDENGDDKCDNCESVLIGSITITGIDAPVGGKNFDTKADFTTADLNDAEVTIVWTKGSEPAGETADYATTYTAKITLARENGTAFLDEVTATVNGKTATVILNDDGTITVTYDFTTATRKIISVQAPTVPERFSNAYTAEDILEACELGDTAKVTLEGEMEPNTVDMAVEWTLANPGGAEYASEIFKKNTFLWTVKAGEYEGYDVNAVSLTGTVTIENAYILEPVATSIPVRVYLQVPEGYEGTYNSKDKYEICLEQKTEAPMPAETPEKYVTADAGEVDFGEITFEKPGTYKYKVELQGEVTGVEKDEKSSKDVNIEVTDNGDGTMNLSCDYTEESPLTFTNILRLTTAGIKVVWEDTENLDGIRPDSITAQLLADGESTGQSVVLNASNNWTAEIKELPQIAAGKDIVYTWSVGTPEGYASSLIQEDTLVTLKYSHELTTKLEGRSVSLGEQIGMNFYMKLTQGLLEDEEAYMLFTLPGGNTSKVMLSEAKQEIKDGEEYYVFTYEGAAKEMADIIKMQMFFGNGIKSGEEYSSSVKEYAEALLEGNVATDAEKKLTKAMLNYGAYAQLYFNYNTGMLANVGCQDADLICDLSYVSAKPSIVDNSEVLDYAGSTLILESKIKVRHYFKVAEGQTYSGNLTKYVPMDGSAMNGDYYYYESDGIPASGLAITQTDAESVPGFEIYYSPLSYVITVIATNNESDLKDDIKLQNLMKALYLYFEAVEDCKREGE